MKNKLKLKYLPAYVFCIIIFAVPVLYLSVKDSEFSSLEKRNLSQLPIPGVESVFKGDFGKDFETYLNDQMPFRTFFVGVNAYYDLLSGRNGMSGIYSAKDDYLTVTPVKENSTFNNNLKYLGEFVETADVPSYICTVPSSGYIYDDKLPLNHYEYKDGQIISKIEDSLGSIENVRVVNITDTFKQLKNDEQLYYKTDHHWTSQGAYECYKLLGESMNFTPTPKESFNIESCGGFYGTNYSKSGLWLKPSESIELWVNEKRQKNSLRVCVFEGEDVTFSDDCFFRDNLKTNDQYTAFLDGNHGIVTISNKNAQTDKKLLVLRDSYSHCLAPFLADNYSLVTLVDIRYYFKPVSDLVKEQDIDEILIIYSIDSIVNSTDIAGIY